MSLDRITYQTNPHIPPPTIATVKSFVIVGKWGANFSEFHATSRLLTVYHTKVMGDADSPEMKLE